MKPLKCKIPIQVRFKDLDMLGHVNSAIHYTYFELGRIEYFGLFENGINSPSGLNFVVAKTEMEYLEQILLKDKLHVSVWVTRIGTKSFDMSCSIVKDEAGKETEVAKGKAIVVCFDLKKNESVKVPTAWKEIMLADKN